MPTKVTIILCVVAMVMLILLLYTWHMFTEKFYVLHLTQKQDLIGKAWRDVAAIISCQCNATAKRTS
jgi:hypothetical protein